MNKSFTLIEIMVSVFIFFLIVAGPTGFFVSSLRAQQKLLASQELIGNISYTLEYISRALRMAKKDLDGSCIPPSEAGNWLNYKKTESRVLEGITYSGPGIKFENYKKPPQCQEFFLDLNDKRLKESKNGSSPLPLTSDDLEIVSFKIGPDESWDQNDNLQPRITLLLEIRGKGQRPQLKPEIKIQTTISQRNLDVRY